MSVIQGMDTIPREIARDFADQLDQWLPGWKVNGEYNYAPGATTQRATSQLQYLMHNGSHPWINEQIRSLLDELDADTSLSANVKTQRAAALINFMHEASSPEAVRSGGARTGNFIAYASRSDPNLIAKLNYQPTPDQMRALTAQGMSWDRIMASDAGREVVALNPRKVGGRLVYDGKLGNSGFFSRTIAELETNGWKTMSSTAYSRAWRAANGITGGLFGGWVQVNGQVVRQVETNQLLSTKTLTRNGAAISTFGRASTKLLGRVAKPLAVVTLLTLSSTANAAQLDSGYTTNLAVPANKAFIEELFGLATGSLAGLVAGVLAGAATAGLLAIPVGLAAALAGDAAGRLLGGIFYDNFTSAANEIAEWMVPALAPLGDAITAAGGAIGEAADAVAAAIDEIASMIFGAVTDGYEFLGELVSGSDGLFGKDGPLFGKGKPLHALVELAQSKNYLKQDGTWVYGGFDEILFGTDGDDVIIHDSGTGQLIGGKGDDVLLGVFPRYVEAGQPLFVETDQPIAEVDSRLFLDGGEGNDWVITVFGEKAVTSGGLGRDWIFNTSLNGEIWGDIANSYDLGRYREAQVDGETVRIEDNAANSDNIWYWADTTLMDAGHSDFLKYFGLPLVGGDANGGLAGYAIYNGLFGAAIGMGNIYRYLSGEAQGWEDEIYIDHIQPWIMYGFKRDEDGSLDMYITNAFEQIFAGLNAALGLGQQNADARIHKGWMKIENVDVVGSRLGVLQREADQLVLSNGKVGGSLNMVFRAVNPLQALLPVIKLIPGAIGAALYYTVFVDALVSTVAAMERWAESLKWSNPGDPLVIDLDGDGIETTSLEQSRAYFDVDGDMFRERTGWLKGDDGFLVLDANNNGRVDGIGELFGDRFQGGFAELAAYDDNGDGKISVADLIWSEMKVWQDRDRDGETDAGELRSLSALGIVEFNLGNTALNATTPQGARLLSRSDVRFANGRVTSMFEAIFTSNEVDTKYAGEAGRAPWQNAETLNAKGFGTITDLAVATANDNEFSIPMTRIAA